MSEHLEHFGDATVAVVTFAPPERLLRRGRRLQRPTEDIHQLGADLVIGRDGRVRYLALPPSPDARPPISELIAALD